jgi:hypothetical protein
MLIFDWVILSKFNHINLTITSSVIALSDFYFLFPPKMFKKYLTFSSTKIFLSWNLTWEIEIKIIDNRIILLQAVSDAEGRGFALKGQAVGQDGISDKAKIIK